MGGRGLDHQALRVGVLGEESWILRSRAMAVGDGPVLRSACTGFGPNPKQDIGEALIKGQ